MNIDNALMNLGLELLPRFLVNMGRAVHRVDGALGRQRYGAGNQGSRVLRCTYDLFTGFIQQDVIVCSQTDAYFLSGHFPTNKLVMFTQPP